MEGRDPSLLAQARRGDPAALGQLLEHHRDWLRRMAEGELQGRMAARLSASDLVQQTCLSAIRQFSDFDGLSEAQFQAWLREVHKHNIQDAVRRHAKAAKRAVGGQQSLDAATSAATPPAPTASPSQQAIRAETSAQLEQAIGSLPADQATAVRLRHLHHKSLREIAAEMDRTEVAVASLLKRGLETLRQRVSRSG